MDVNPYRESGLPPMTADVGGAQGRYALEKGVVTAIYPDLWRVDIAPDGGGLLRKALVVGEVLPPVHEDTTQPSHVLFGHISGNIQDVVCWPLNFRRMRGPESADDGHDRHFYQLNRQIVRVGDITIRVTPKNEIYMYDAESGDYQVYDMPNRTWHSIVPHFLLGTDDASRIQYDQSVSNPTQDAIRAVIPNLHMGKTGLQDQDGLSYTADQLLHLVSTIMVQLTAGTEIHLIAPLVKITASGSIVLDPPHIYLGNASATEPVILGNLFRAFLNLFLTLFNGHSHSNVQNGGGVSGAPTVATALMDTSTLSTIAKVSE